MTEEQKYHNSTYKPKKQKSSQRETATTPKNMAHNAYVEDVTEEYEAYRDYEIRESDGDDSRSAADLLEAPTPPPAADSDANVNVFDFLVEATPNASNVDLLQTRNLVPAVTQTRQLVRFESDSNEYVDPTGYMVDDGHMAQYGEGSVPMAQFQTPVPKGERKKNKDGELKKDKKRKRLHIETPGPLLIEGPGDHVMTDAPPVLHSGLTGGMDRMMRPSQFPPSPDYSGGDGGDHSPIPASPIKKSKHAKSTKPRTEGLGLKSFMSGTSKTKTSKKRKHSSERKEKKKKTRQHTSHHRSDSDKVPKLIEYRPQSSDSKDGEAGQMILYKPRSDVFLSLCNKGPESERGCSVNKALKRYHRERSQSGTSLGKSVEEKELWRSLRMRRNERGEIVLFSLDDEE